MFEVERKYREVNGDYFPELRKRSNNGGIPISSRVTQGNKQEKHNDMSIEEYFSLQEDLNKLKALHEDYHRKIDAKMLQKNKLLDEQTSLEENIRYS